MELVFPAPLESRLRASLFSDTLEACAIVLARRATRGGRERMIVVSLRIPAAEDYVERTQHRVVLSPEFFVPLVGEALEHELALCFVHSHPMDGSNVSFSATDDDGEARLAAYFRARAPQMPVLSIVYGPMSRAARVLGTDVAVPVATAGARSVVCSTEQAFDAATYDRQVKAFGAAGQRVLAGMNVGIVGLGGTGSIVAQELALLGVSKFALIDPDNLEKSNANRVVGVTAASVGAPKVEVARAHILERNPVAEVQALQENVLRRAATELALSCDFLFCCTDSHGSRALLNQVAYQYLVPCIDMGVALDAALGDVTRIAGRVQLLAPGLACLACLGVLDSESVRLDFLSDAQREREPYFLSGGVSQPAVVSLNATIASLGVTMFLATAVGIPSSPRLLFYDGMTGTVRPTVCEATENCVVCSHVDGAVAKGDSWPLPELG